VKEIDNRGSSFYLSLYWAQALANQTQDADLQARFAKIASALEENEQLIMQELIDVQGVKVDVGGYYMHDPVKAAAVMRPSEVFNRIIDEM
jgi:isocitrate dehydrogenase